MTLILTGLLGQGAGVAQADPSVADLDRQIAAANERLETLIEQRNGAEADLLATKSRASAAQARVDELTATLGQAQSRVGDVAAWAYRSGPVSQFTAVLEADSPSDFLGRLATLETLGRAEHGQVNGLAGLLAEFRSQRDALQQLSSSQQAQQQSFAALTTQVEQDLTNLRQLRSQAVTPAAASRSRSAVPSDLTPPAVSGAAGVALAFAYAQIGKGYQYAAAGPNAYDCSGLTMAAWQAAGVSLPHNAARQFSSVAHVSRAELAPGDLVFYYSDIHHVALYVGDGQVIHAPNSGETVRVDGMDMAPIAGYGRP
jgi:cell wall-associated NlpC family hydrolase